MAAAGRGGGVCLREHSAADEKLLCERTGVLRGRGVPAAAERISRTGGLAGGAPCIGTAADGRGGILCANQGRASGRTRRGQGQIACALTWEVRPRIGNPPPASQ